jgi:putative flippase GtrA
LRFALIGAVAFVVDAVTLNGAMRLAGMNHYAGRAISYLMAATLTWALNRRYTFYARASTDRLGEWARFLAANACGGLLNYTTYAVLVAFSRTVFVYPVLGVAAGSLAGMTLNFALSRRFVFTVGYGGNSRLPAPSAQSFSRVRVVSAVLLALAVLSYALWLRGRHFHFLMHGHGFGLTFNSMLEHLLRGEFDVDPGTVGLEGFRRDGHVVAYWGIFCALIRLPLVLIPGGLTRDVTCLSCLVAVTLAAGTKLLTLQLVHDSTPPSTARHVLYWSLVAAVLFSGAQIEFLRPTLYQEVCLWAGALAAGFVYFAVRGIVRGTFSAAALCVMGVLAGLALLTRVSMGIGLYTALALLLIVILIQSVWQGASTGPEAKSKPSLALLWRQFLAPALVLLVFAMLVGLVNYGRWGDPLVFADYRSYLMNALYPDRLARTEAYGLFNLERVPFGLVYYFLPIWVLVRGDGQLLFEEHQRRLMDATELPPSSFFLTDPLLILVCVYAAWALLSLRRSSGVNRLHVLAIAAGLGAACLLMLSAISMTFRYRIEFYPLMEFGAFLGFFLLCRSRLATISLRAVSTAVIASASLGILASHAVLVLYKTSYFGPPIDLLRRGVVAYYLERIHSPWL